MDIIPGAVSAQQKVVFTKADGSTYMAACCEYRIQKSYRYQYDVTLGKDGVDPVPTVKYMEQPVISRRKYTI
jgi:endonuclease G